MDFDTLVQQLTPEQRERLEYRPYKDLGCYARLMKHLSTQNVLMKMPTSTIISMFISVSVFLVLFVYSAYNDNNFERVVHSVALDSVLNLMNIYIYTKKESSGCQKFLDYLPEFVRGLSIASYYVYIFSKDKQDIFIYLTLLYMFPTVFRIFSCSNYSKCRFFGVNSSFKVGSG